MSTTKKPAKKDSLILFVAVAFILGFLSGSAFTIYKTGPKENGSPAPSSSATDQQSQAILHLEAEVTANPDNFQSWTRLANLYYDTDQFEKAIKAYEKSLELHSGNGDIWTDLGVMYRRSKQPHRAIEAFDKAIEVEPTHEKARLNKGIVFMYDLNNAKKALQSWEDLLRMNPDARSGNGDSIGDFVEQVKKDLAKTQQ